MAFEEYYPRQPSLYDLSQNFEFPDYRPPPPPLPPPSPPKPKETPPTEDDSDEGDDSDDPHYWKVLQRREDERLLKILVLFRKNRVGILYKQFSDEHVDWELEGVHKCRIKSDLGCHDKDFETLAALELHLNSEVHQIHRGHLLPKEKTSKL